MRRDDLNLPDPPPYDRPGDKWMCGAHASEQGCVNGPSRHGRCPLADTCHPKRTWYGRRHQIAVSAFVIAAILGAWCLRPNAAPEVFKPGELSTPHAQILAGTQNADRCATCHRDASINPVKWFGQGKTGHATVTQADRCLDCHHQTIKPDVAKLAHNLPLSVREEIRGRIRLASANSKSTWHDRLPGPAVNQENLECSACHREHRGATADLLAVSDSQCQTCHSDRYGSFATSHPDWQQWPYGRGGDIAFNHQTHANKHFLATTTNGKAAEFRCEQCHEVNEHNELTRAVSFERGCQSCHDESLNIEAGEGIELLALPSLPTATAGQVANWPTAATGFADGKLSPLAQLLLRSETNIADAIVVIPDGDFSKVSTTQISAVDATVAVASAHQTLLADLATGGHPAATRRTDLSGISRQSVNEILRGLPPQLLAETYAIWFNHAPPIQRQASAKMSSGVRQSGHNDQGRSEPALLLAMQPQDDLLLGGTGGDDLLLGGSGEDLLSDDALNDDPLNADPLAADPLSVDPLSADPLASPPVSSATHDRFDPARMLTAGGWYRDDLKMAIAYRGLGHSDPVLKAAVEMVGQLSSSDPVRQRLLATRAIAACVSCHPGATHLPPTWQGHPLVGRKTEFTKFSHASHLNVASLRDCRHCHKINSRSANLLEVNQVGFVNESDRQEPGNQDAANQELGNHGLNSQFHSLGREACAACHTAKAAGDGCITCHRYHIQK